MTATKPTIDLTTADRAPARRPHQDERDLIMAVGVALYGEFHYVTRLAEELDVGRRTLERVLSAALDRDGDVWRLWPDTWAKLLALAEANADRVDLLSRLRVAATTAKTGPRAG